MIQNDLIHYLDYETNIEENYQNLKNIFSEYNIHDDQHKLKLLLYLISKISNNHYRGSNFFSKIERVLLLFKDDMTKYFSKSELYNIFKSSKRLLLFLFEEKIITFDEFIVKNIINNDKYLNQGYQQYFQPEIQPFINEEWFPKYNKNNRILKNINNAWVENLKEELPADFYEKRRIGENDDYVCSLIRQDLIEDFIIYVKKNFYPADYTITPSIYETNNLLLKKKNIKYIEYAVFFGSTQIFNYLRQNGADLEPSLWIFAVHGQSEEIIRFLEDNKILPNDEEEENKCNNNVSFEQIYKESIKCYSIDASYYIRNNYSPDEKYYSIKYYNFVFIEDDNKNIDDLFYFLCGYNFYPLVCILLKQKDININKKIIYISAF